MDDVRIALVHEFLGSTRGGQEEVLRELHTLFPHAPIYTIIADRDHLSEEFTGWDIRPSFIQNLPFGVSHFQWYLPLMPQAVERLDLHEFDIVISSSSAFAKGVITSPRTLHLCYCHTPTRYLWSDAHTYVRDRHMRWPLRPVVQHYLGELRIWDRLAAERPDIIIANSSAVRQRIAHYYRRDASVIYPPVAIEYFTVGHGAGGYFLTGGRLVESKRFDLVVQAFNRLRIPLIIFGSGRDEARLRALAGPTITFTGYVDRAQRARLFADARAFIYPQVEDFGITAVESMAAGRPVIAYPEGGTLETVIEGVTGTFFAHPTWESLADVVARFQFSDFDPLQLRRHAEGFSAERFRDRMHTFLTSSWEQHNISSHSPGVIPGSS